MSTIWDDYRIRSESLWLPVQQYPEPSDPLRCPAQDGLGELAKSMAQLHLTLDAVDDAPNSHYLRGHPAISDAFEKCVSAEYFASFLTTGTLADRSSFRRLTDEEYLCGVISLCHELNRYVSV